MKKILLSLAAMAAFCTGATAENVGDTITTTDLKYRVHRRRYRRGYRRGQQQGHILRHPVDRHRTDGKTYTVTAIGVEAFKWTSATTVVLPSTLKEIKADAFASADALSAISFPEGLKKIGRGAFSSCSSIKSIDILASVDSIGDNAFFGTSWKEDATKLTLHEGLKYIGESAFYSQDFTEVDIPASVQEIAARHS